MYLFGAGLLWGTPLTDASGVALATPTPILMGTIQEAGVDISFDNKMLYGNLQFPVAVGRGKGKVSGKIKAAEVNGAIFNSLLFGQTLSAGLQNQFYDTVGKAIPSTPFTLTVSSAVSSATNVQLANPSDTPVFVADLGVVFAATGQRLTRVASAPAVGQYTFSVSAGTGTYVFNTADATKTVYINYQYTAAPTGALKSSVANKPMGYAPTIRVDLNIPFNGKQLSLILPNCITGKLGLATKNEDFVIPEFEFDAFADSSNNIMYYSMPE
jgi:hypothetical protein